MKLLATAALAIWILPAPTAAGTRIDAETRRLDRPRAAAEHATLRVDGERLRFDDGAGKNSLIYRADRGLLWFLDHGEQTYVEVNRNTAAGVAAAVKDTNAMLRESIKDMPPERRAALEGLLDGTLGPPPEALPEVSVRATGERVLVEGRVCEEHEVKRGPEKLALVCTASNESLGLSADDLAVLPELVAFMREAFESLSGVLPDAVGREALDTLSSFDRLAGVPLRVRTFQDGKARAESVVTDVASETLDPGHFERPPGYRGGFSLGGSGTR